MKYYYPIDIDAIMTVSAGSFTNEFFANDQNIGFSVTDVSNGDRLRWLFDTAKQPDFLAIYVTSGSGNVIIKDDPGNTVSTTALSIGWNIIAVTGSSQDWYIEFSGVSSLQFSEAYFAYVFTFPYNYQLGNSFRRVYGVDSVSNSVGDEFTNKRHDAKWIRSFDWKNFSQANIELYEAFDLAVDGTRAKFIFDDGDDLWWVKQTVGINYTEAGCSAYDPSSGLRQQLN